MELDKIIRLLEESPKKFPYSIIPEVIKHKEQMIPKFLSLLENPLYIFEKCKEIKFYLGHIYASFFLAQFRVKKLEPLLLNLCHYPYEQFELIGSDFYNESYPRLIATVWNGNLEPIQKILENAEFNEYIRNIMLQTLLHLAIHRRIPKQELISYLNFLFDEGLERKESIIWSGLVKISG